MSGPILRLRSLAMAGVLPILLVSCGRVADDGSSVAIDAGRVESDAAAPIPPPSEEGDFASSVGMDIEGCSASEGAATVTLVRQPDYLSVFHFVAPSGCESLDRSAVFRNVGTAPVRVLGISFDRSEFSTSNTALASPVGPGQAVAIPVRFRGDQSATATMTVIADSGCQTFEVLGVPSSDSLFDLSAAAIDFGDVVMGDTSERRITLQMQFITLPEGLDGRVGFGVDPEGSFEIVSGPPSPQPMESCVPVEIELRFRAPRVPGPVTGQLGYSLGPGDGWVELYGRAVEE